MRCEELHFSALKQFARSPAHFKAYTEREFVSSPAMNLGTLIHALVLGGEYVCFEAERRGKAWTDFKSANEGKFIVTATELEKAKRAADAVLGDRVAAPLLEGRHEHAWNAVLYGRKAAGRIDVAGPCTVDLKSAADVEPYRFQRTCLRMAYHAQLAWYADARRALGENPGECFIIGVESSAPYAVTTLRITPRALDEGRKLTRLWVERLIACELADEWPGYAQSALDLDIVEDAGLIIDGEALSLEDMS